MFSKLVRSHVCFMVKALIIVIFVVYYRYILFVIFLTVHDQM